MTDLYFTFLSIHILGAVSLFAWIFFALLSLKVTTLMSYRKQAMIISINGGVQLVTGSLVGLAHHGNPVTFCAKIGLYLAVIAVTELALYWKMQHKEAFPAATVYSTLTIGMLFAVMTVISF